VPGESNRDFGRKWPRASLVMVNDRMRSLFAAFEPAGRAAAAQRPSAGDTRGAVRCRRVLLEIWLTISAA